MRTIGKITTFRLGGKAAVAALTLALVACGGAKPPPKTGGTGGGGEGKPEAVATQAKATYDDAVQKFVAHDQKNDWNDATCTEMANAFLAANDTNKKEVKAELPAAIYNAGLSYQRCQKDADAKKYFQQALAADPKFHRAKVQIALYDYKSGGDAALEPTIQALQQAVLDAEFQNSEALVNLAMLEMKRDSSQGWQGCNSDLECAKKNIQRALAVDDSYMPAFNQLALYYLNRARDQAGASKAKYVAGRKKKGQKRVDQQQLDLAALVCSQAIRKNPTYAPIHNTAGLIQAEGGNINNAVAEFKRAADLDPNFFEALMNYAAVNLGFRGFKNAEDAYRQALKLRPNDFDAHLGLALALRGQINDSNWDANVKGAQDELDAAKGIDPNRPETYYNAGILTQEFKVKGISDQKGQIPVLDQAVGLYNDFISKAGSAPEFQDAVKRAKERISDINDIKKFITEGIKAAEEAPPPTTEPGGLEGDQGQQQGGDQGQQGGGDKPAGDADKK